MIMFGPISNMIENILAGQLTLKLTSSQKENAIGMVPVSVWRHLKSAGLSWGKAEVILACRPKLIKTNTEAAVAALKAYNKEIK